MENQKTNQIKEFNDFQHQYRIPFNEVNKWKHYLDQNGFVVVRNFLSQQQCQNYMNQVWDMMERLSLGKLKRNNLETQKNPANYPSSHHGGLMQYIGHSKFQWDLRKLTKPIFQELWGDKNLKCSFDGVCFSNGLLNYPHNPENQGLHVDQAPIKNKLWSYQGIMALTTAGTDGGGFVCVPKSHLYFSQYFKEKNMQTRTRSWNFPEQDRYQEPICHYIKVNVEAGDFMIFDSRTFHCGCPPRNENLRAATYICMMPAKLVPQIKAQERKQVFKTRMNSGHHCGDGFRTFPKIPRTAPKDKDELAEFQKIVNQLNQVGTDDLEKDKEVMSLV